MTAKTSSCSSSFSDKLLGRDASLGIHDSESENVSKSWALAIRVKGVERPQEACGSSCMRALLPLGCESCPPTECNLGEGVPGNHVHPPEVALQKGNTELPLPPIREVERECNIFVHDTVTLVFRCALSGHEHRVVTKQWSRPACEDSLGDRLATWASMPFQLSKPWEEEMEESELSPAGQAELNELLTNSGWYDHFEFHEAGGGCWIFKDTAARQAPATDHGWERPNTH